MMRTSLPSGTSPRRRASLEKGAVEKASLERGFSLMEIVISAAILSMLILITARTLAGGQKLLGTTSMRSDGEMNAEKIAREIAERIANGAIDTLRDGSDALIPDGGTSTTGLSVALVEKFVGEANLKGSVGIRLGADGESDGTSDVGVAERDDDRDNLVDERSVSIVEWTDSPATDTRLSAWTTAPAGAAAVRGTIGNRLGGGTTGAGRTAGDPGLTVRRTGNLLEITVTVMRHDQTMPGATVAERVRYCTAKAFVALKN